MNHACQPRAPRYLLEVVKSSPNRSKSLGGSQVGCGVVTIGTGEILGKDCRCERGIVARSTTKKLPTAYCCSYI
ncbi:hypothetical protein PISMIDRAFT_189137 [Pisolithus microcarpus 441]|uniref:Uncharacterized protein n=1 Tax=Pisolithus microcarpus 441 TaxID=765257 RepID=A0A0C9ZZB9_9AGAM|nr:hypothetical protein PISMIDRAFT_189137 [Pisolithus microcarpus 441]